MTPEPIRILLIEDEPDLRETLGELLEERGYLVETVASSGEAVELARNERFDVVVTDIRTEGQYDGLSALEKVKESQPEVSGVVITGYSTEDYALRAVKLQVEDYLKKPFQLSDFIQRIESIASQKRRSKAQAQRNTALRRTLLWFAEQLAQMGTEQAPLDPEGFLQIVRTLAGRARLGEELSQELLIAAALSFSEEVMALELPSDLQDTLPGSVLSIMRHRYERWDGQGEPEGLAGESIPVGSRILKLALALAARSGSSAAALVSGQAGEFDPSLAPLYDQEETPEVTVGDARSMLAVGLALEDAGEFEQALDTFRVLARDYPGTRAQVFGSLGEARLNRGRGNLEAAAQAAERSFGLAKRQGPSLAAECGLQAGILLSQQNDERGKAVLIESSRLLSEIRDVGGRAVSVLALKHFWEIDGPVETAARTLLSSEFTPDLQAAAGWLARFVLKEEAKAMEVSDVLLDKLAMDCPSSLLQCCLDGSLDVSARVNAIACLSKSLPNQRVEAVLESLSSDGSSEVRQAASQALHKAGSGERQLATLRLCCLGGFRVYRGDRRLDTGWKRLKPKFFLAYLASMGTRLHSDDSLIEVFWPGDPDKGRASLRAALSYLRRQLQPEDGEGDVNYFLKPPGNVRINPELPIWYDLLEVRKSVTRMRQLNSGDQVEKAVALARHVAKLYEGPFLDSCYMDWAVRLRDDVDMAVGEALHLLIDWCRSAQRLDEVIEFGQRALLLDPTDEDIHLALMEAFNSQGRHSEALRHFERCEKVLREELDAEPSPELVQARTIAAGAL